MMKYSEDDAVSRFRSGFMIAPLCLLLLVVAALVNAQDETSRSPANMVVIKPGETMEEIVRKAANVVPSPRQLAWQEQEFIAFIHFGMNTFTDREWGLGTESPALFNPADLDARQWVKAMKDAGIKRAIVTAKHHDGFCLWPSKYTEHSVKSSPWRGGKGDVVGEVAAACKEYGLDFAVYLSPWDRHEPCYGDSPKYNEHFRNQLRELLTNYGTVTEMWFDGACGEGPNGKRQVYDWQSYYKLIRELQPSAVIAIMGPDVRWVGTESGYGRETEWSVLPDIAQNLDAIAAGSQQNPVDGAFVPHDLTSEDLGSRTKLRNAKSLVWYPAETNTSIRPGWFYHADQDARVKTPEKLVDIYYSSVGRNGVFLLNLPPDKRGRIHDNDIKNLMSMRKILDQTFGTDVLAGASATASSEQNDKTAACAIDKDNSSYWTTADGVSSATMECVFADTRTFDRALLQEYIRVGQRVEGFHLDAWDGQGWKQVVQGTTIGYKRLLRFPPVTTSRIRLVIDSSRTSPAISTFSLHKSPPRVVIEHPAGGGFRDSLVVRLSADREGVPIYYTLDGTTPTLRSARYSSPIVLKNAATLVAVAALNGELCIESTEARFIKCRPMKGIVLEKPCDPKYHGHGDATLIDGHRAAVDFENEGWLGFNGDDLVATVDLGTSGTIHKITAGFLQQQGSWIFLPSRVTFSTSIDGAHWKEQIVLDSPVVRTEEVRIHDYICAPAKTRARYIKVVARSIGTCPSWHSGAGDKAWLFVDEIYVE